MTAAGRLAELAALPAAAHEALCTNCGACCFLTVRIGGGWGNGSTMRCPYLEGDAPGGYRCTVYADRYARAPWCKPIEAFVAQGAAPRDCPYTSGIDDYQGSTVLTGAEAERAAHALRGLYAAGRLRVSGSGADDFHRFDRGDARRHLPVAP